jgi:hypothetical protein
MHIVVGLVVVISTSPRSSKSESGIKIYYRFSIVVSASFLGAGLSAPGPDYPPPQKSWKRLRTRKHRQKLGAGLSAPRAGFSGLSDLQRPETATFLGLLYIPLGQHDLGLPALFIFNLQLIKNTPMCWATKLPRSPPSSTQSSWSLGNRRRRHRSTTSPRRFTFPPHLLEGPVVSVSIGTLVLDSSHDFCIFLREKSEVI